MYEIKKRIMAYLTNYTYGKLCRTIDIGKEINLEMFTEFVYNDKYIYFIFNKLEVKYLFNYKNILEDENKFLIDYYKEVPEKKDEKKYVFEKGGKLKYHILDNCTFINNDFIDFNIPPEINEFGDTAIDEYRDWFKRKGFADLFYNNNLDLKKVVRSYNMIYPKKYNISPLNEEYKLIEKKDNSNSRKIESEFDIEIFTKKLEVIKKKFNNKFSSPISRKLSKFNYLLNKSNAEIEDKMREIFTDNFTSNYGINNLKENWKFSKNLKSDLVRHLIEYFKWKYKLNSKSFNSTTLDEFGLKCCGNCERNYSNQNAK